MNPRFKAPGGFVTPLLLVSTLVSAYGASLPDTGLVVAVEKQDKQAIRSLLKGGADVNAAEADGATPIAWAAHWDDLETTDLLIRAGANVNLANDVGVTPLSLACANGSGSMVEKLLTAGANPNATQPLSGETAVMTCARTGSTNGVKELIARGADVNAREKKRGHTALMWAVAAKHPEAAVTLIEHGADIHARSKSGFTALLFAAQQGDLDTTRILLDKGANVNEATPRDGSALVVAAASGHEALAKFLLDKDADPNAADGDGITALHYAIRKGISILDGVVAQPVLAYLFRPDMIGLAEALLSHGANPNARIAKIPSMPNSRRLVISPAGATPFLLAAATYDTTLMRILLAAGADPRMTTKENTSPLMMASEMGRAIGRLEDLRDMTEESRALEAVQFVVAAGADVNAANDAGLTALHGAAYTGADSIINFLVARGAQMDRKDKAGQTPLSIAERFYPAGLPEFLRPMFIHESTANLLRKLGAAPTDQSTAAALGRGTSKTESGKAEGIE